jgi:hypothetical protein
MLILFLIDIYPFNIYWLADNLYKYWLLKFQQLDYLIIYVITHNNLKNQSKSNIVKKISIF